MFYEKPKCDCGEELFLYEEMVFLLETKINKNGILSKKSKRSTEMNHNVPRLRCGTCFKEWNFDKDREGRIIKVDTF